MSNNCRWCGEPLYGDRCLGCDEGQAVSQQAEDQPRHDTPQALEEIQQLRNRRALIAAINALDKTLRDQKPADRSESARKYAIAITELEKLRAYTRVEILWSHD